MVSAAGASQPPTRHSTPQRVGVLGQVGVCSRGISRRTGKGSGPWSGHWEGSGETGIFLGTAIPLCLQTPVGPESPPARMVGVRVCSGCVTHGETAQREVTTSAAAPCFHFQVRSLAQGRADLSFITLRKRFAILTLYRVLMVAMVLSVTPKVNGNLGIQSGAFNSSHATKSVGGRGRERAPLHSLLQR